MENKQFDFHEIETFADACMRLGISAESLHVDSLGDKEAFLQANALYKLLIIQKAINNGVWHNEKDCCYFPYWILYSKKGIKRMSENEKQICGLKELTLCTNTGQIYSGVNCAVAYSNSMVTAYGFPLCFNSEEAARYAAKQFEDLFFQYYGIKVKK
jgi:hypothetical protein